MVLRLAVLLAVLLAPLSGCKQSLFDSHVDDVDGGGGGGGDGPGGGDAMAPTSCPAPCVGDAVADFSESSQDVWAYLDDDRNLLGLNYAAMTWDGSAWAGVGDPAPTIGRDGDRLTITSTVMTPGHHDPALAFAVATTGLYRVSGELRLADGASAGAMQRLRVSRNFRHDSLYDLDYIPSASGSVYDLDVELLAGERYLVSASPSGDGDPAVLSASSYISGPRPLSESTCLMAYTFDGSDPMTDSCRNLTLVGCPNPTGDPGPEWSRPTTTTGAAPQFGNALHFAQEQCLATPVAMDWSGDFTLQFWMKIEDDDPTATLHWPYGDVMGDMECAVGGGLKVSLGSGIFGVYFFMDGDDCTTGFTTAAEFDHATDQAWHFYRITRSTATDKLQVCVDGALAGEVATRPDVDISSGETFHFGNFGTWYPELTGGYDDVRAFKRALPCR